ncbi:AbrB/MazE/SpoVT family DNA-binding domain-containing protein [Candidatus Woesearchaeota archaeon]|nr:AbrB/MazE/SpoVT family DNA-binding domain-containing protein [Candidatus Woesearchaeota archaeon]
MPELVSVGEKGQIVIPKQFREELHIEKGTKLLIAEEGEKLILKKVDIAEDMLWMLVGEETLKKTWDNPYDKQWDDFL